MPKSDLSSTEFAIKEGAKFKVVSVNKLVVGTAGTITMVFKLDVLDDILVGPVEDLPADFDPCGVFRFDNKIAGTINELTLSINSNNPPQILLTSTEGDITLVTDAEKGEHGKALKSSTTVPYPPKRKPKK